MKRIDTTLVAVRPAPRQEDVWLERMWATPEGAVAWSRPRLTLTQVTDAFLRRFPGGFDDPDYLGDREHGERVYKLKAHELWRKTLDHGEGRRLLTRGSVQLLTDRVLAVDNQLNLISHFEKMALRDGLRDRASAKRFFETLLVVVEGGAPSRALFEPYIDAVTRLPAEEGRARVATWPVLTLFPFIARPDRHMLLKPGITQHCAEILGFDLGYTPALNWLTYERLLEMSALLIAHLAPHGARDLIDIQSFMWVTKRLADGEHGPATS